MPPIRAISRNRGGDLLKILNNGYSEGFGRRRRRKSSSHIRVHNYYFQNGRQVRRERGFQGGREFARCKDDFCENDFYSKMFNEIYDIFTVFFPVRTRDLRHHLRHRECNIFDGIERGDLRSRIGPRRSRPRKKARKVTTVYEKEFDADPDLAPMIGPFRPTSPECKKRKNDNF